MQSAELVRSGLVVIVPGKYLGTSSPNLMAFAILPVILEEDDGLVNGCCLPLICFFQIAITRGQGDGPSASTLPHALSLPRLTTALLTWLLNQHPVSLKPGGPS